MCISLYRVQFIYRFYSFYATILSNLSFQNKDFVGIFFFCTENCPSRHWTKPNTILEYCYTPTNFRTVVNRTVIRDAALPDRLNYFFARFHQLNRHPTKGLEWCRGEGTACDTETGSQGLVASEPQQGSGTRPSRTKNLRACVDQLTGIYTDIFNSSFSQEQLPRIFKWSAIVPDPKKPNTTTLNDYSTVALTLVAMNCLEKVFLQQLNTVCPDPVDPLQFA